MGATLQAYLATAAAGDPILACLPSPRAEPRRTGWHSHERISTLLFLRGRTALQPTRSKLRLATPAVHSNSVLARGQITLGPLHWVYYH
ncbi:unnamed protein product [Clonostachys solani]|uniref:Uncharacterized protein n=1 Tax=Clonostachys solani TaxID=160281 RepID=A0A9N9Z576_9HYPO|nr:unnamed protein product [Clonostachys solani]